MKKILLAALMAIVICPVFGLSHAQSRDDTKKAYIDITLEFNKDIYPRKYGIHYPTYVIWVQDKKTGEVRTIYATKKLASDAWLFAKERPSAAPVWYSFKDEEVKRSGPLNLDAISSATPTEKSQHIRWQVPPEFLNKELIIYLEANVSFDYNEFYSKEAKKTDKGYSSVNGQPSLVWQATVKTDNESKKDFSPEPIGHGHVLGADHKIDPDLSHITTAKDLFLSIRYSYVVE